MGIAALAIAAVGAVTVDQDSGAGTGTQAIERLSAHTSALGGVDRVVSGSSDRQAAVSRDLRREALHETKHQELLADAEAQADERSAALARIASSAEDRADELAADTWALPLTSYRLTGTFGQSSSLWSVTHTGLDFAAASGTPITAVATGIITDVGYSGAYGNRTVVTLEDGTEIWYCHQASFAVNVGETVDQGETVGYVGSTGNVTGPHLHLEVRPGAGDPVDPYAALVAHGVRP